MCKNYAIFPNRTQEVVSTSEIENSYFSSLVFKISNLYMGKICIFSFHPMPQSQLSHLNYAIK